jgi:wyosine [tRNA(Phe)-imidazoG37] synthetase (radical SAM superfamily)
MQKTEPFKLLELDLTTIKEKVCLTGGEPTLHPRIRKLIQQAKDAGLKVKCYTNGCHPDKIHNIFLADCIEASFHCSNKNILESLMGRTGIYEKMIKSLDILKNEYKKEVVIHIVITNVNLDYLEETIKFLNNNYKFNIHCLHVQMIGGIDPNEYNNLKLNKDEKNRYYKICEKYDNVECLLTQQNPLERTSES